MKEIYVHQDYTRVGFYKSILDEAGIPNLVRNEATHSSMSELPSPIFFRRCVFFTTRITAAPCNC
jgi:hypothetical protein